MLNILVGIMFICTFVLMLVARLLVVLFAASPIVVVVHLAMKFLANKNLDNYGIFCMLWIVWSYVTVSVALLLYVVGLIVA